MGPEREVHEAFKVLESIDLDNEGGIKSTEAVADLVRFEIFDDVQIPDFLKIRICKLELIFKNVEVR